MWPVIFGTVQRKLQLSDYFSGDELIEEIASFALPKNSLCY